MIPGRGSDKAHAAVEDLIPFQANDLPDGRDRFDWHLWQLYALVVKHAQLRRPTVEFNDVEQVLGGQEGLDRARSLWNDSFCFQQIRIGQGKAQNFSPRRIAA